MAVYAIGDVQGCYDELQSLLEKIQFDPSKDMLWFAGDLVNRGLKSLEVLRFVKGLEDSAIVVLGNHDLHLLAVALGCQWPRPKDTFDQILAAPDRNELLDWLRYRPLLHHDSALGYTLIHAGLPPQWGLEVAKRCALEAEAVLRSDGYVEFIEQMYGNEPVLWENTLTGNDRLRFIINCFTRLRYCDEQGRLELNEKGAPGKQPPGYFPWFDIKGRASADMKIIFGHWSTLGIKTHGNVYALDTGCVWGGELTAMRLDGEPARFSIPCRGVCDPNDDF